MESQVRINYTCPICGVDARFQMTEHFQQVHPEYAFDRQSMINYSMATKSQSAQRKY